MNLSEPGFGQPWEPSLLDNAQNYASITMIDDAFSYTASQKQELLVSLSHSNARDCNYIKQCPDKKLHTPRQFEDTTRISSHTLK